MPRNPFIYGSAVSGDQFVNREDEIAFILNRLDTSQSTTIIGEPHIGKTSLLLCLEDPKVQIKYLGKETTAKWIFSPLINCQDLPRKYTHKDFWKDSLERLKKRPGSKLISKLLKEVEQSSYESRELKRLFEALRQEGRLLILLIDEFECLLLHENFQDPSFFGLLKTLCARIKGVSIVLTSRYSVDELHKIGPNLVNVGSSLFNYTINSFVKPFSDNAIEKLLKRASPNFSSTEEIFIKRVAGRNPFLLQALASSLHTLKPSENLIEDASEKYFEEIYFHFDDLWKNLSDSQRTVTVMLAVKTLDGRALGNSFSYGEIERVDRFGPELRFLAQRGLAEKLEVSSNGRWIFDTEHLLVWRGEKWGISCDSFAWWIRDMIMKSARPIPSSDEWLYKQRYLGLITQGQWDGTKKVIEKLPTWAIKGVAGLARSLWQEIIPLTPK